jgi:hypothetical protein
VSDKINYDRRRFFGTAAMTLAAVQLGSTGSAVAQSGQAKLAGLPTIRPGPNTSFGSLKQIDAGTLDVCYAEAGPIDGPAVILLHGWSYDIHSFVDVTPLLASAGYRVIVPYLRGYGTTRFLSSKTPRNGQQKVVAVDISPRWMLSKSRTRSSVISIGSADGQHHRSALARAPISR